MIIAALGETEMKYAKVLLDAVNKTCGIRKHMSALNLNPEKLLDHVRFNLNPFFDLAIKKYYLEFHEKTNELLDKNMLLKYIGVLCYLAFYGRSQTEYFEDKKKPVNLQLYRHSNSCLDQKLFLQIRHLIGKREPNEQDYVLSPIIREFETAFVEGFCVNRSLQTLEAGEKHLIFVDDWHTNMSGRTAALFGGSITKNDMKASPFGVTTDLAVDITGSLVAATLHQVAPSEPNYVRFASEISKSCEASFPKHVASEFVFHIDRGYAHFCNFVRDLGYHCMGTSMGAHNTHPAPHAVEKQPGKGSVFTKMSEYGTFVAQEKTKSRFCHWVEVSKKNANFSMLAMNGNGKAFIMQYVVLRLKLITNFKLSRQKFSSKTHDTSV